MFFGIALSMWPIYTFKSLLRNSPWDPSIGISEAILILWTELEIFAICWICWVMVWGSSYILYEIYLMLIQSLNVLICNILLFIDIADNSLKTLVWNWEDYSCLMLWNILDLKHWILVSVFYLKSYILFVVASTFVKC